MKSNKLKRKFTFFCFVGLNGWIDEWFAAPSIKDKIILSFNCGMFSYGFDGHQTQQFISFNPTFIFFYYFSNFLPLILSLGLGWAPAQRKRWGVGSSLLCLAERAPQIIHSSPQGGRRRIGLIWVAFSFVFVFELFDVDWWIVHCFLHWRISFFKLRNKRLKVSIPMNSTNQQLKQFISLSLLNKLICLLFHESINQKIN